MSLKRILIAAALAAGSLAAQAALPVWGYQVVHAYPHDRGAFTEGLFWRDGYLYESTGLEGASSLRKVELQTGRVVQGVRLPDSVFGEGIVDWGDKIVGLTWKNQVGYVVDLKDFAFKSRFDYSGEGWGITRNDRELIQSDGTSALRFIDPNTLHETHRVEVTAEGQPVTQINELEWVDGEVYANIWQTDRIARIDPRTGHVLGWIDLAGLLPEAERKAAGQVDVLNGIAYDAAKKRLFVTGKLWPKLYEIKLVRKK
ncbi:MAG: glutaminyl-peptide cyclotransferase [Pelomonas sp.]|nr:glutaminyl-peptide cyclotransferase [Roseateles sp.]